jgi:predicted TIM-barrel fold metal-dependent hydrolase
VNEARVVVGIHTGEAGYRRYVQDWEPVEEFQPFGRSPLRQLLNWDRPPFETIGALICHGVFDRFPNVRVASIEAGAEWLPSLARKLKKTYVQNPAAFGADPIESLQAHVWVTPFFWDDLVALKDAIGIDHVLFGSDWPHPEGLVEPRTFVKDLRGQGLSDREIHMVMRESGRRLVSS